MPEILSQYTNDLGETYYSVRLADGSETIMSPSQWEYYLDTQDALEKLAQADAGSDVSVSDEQILETLEDPANARYELGSEVGEDSSDDAVFIGSATPYSDGDVSAPALYASLPDIDNTFSVIIDWFGDTFFVERTNTTTRTGYHSERYSYSGTAQIYELPFEETVTETVQVLNPAAIFAAVLVVLTFVTVVTWLRNAIFGRMS